jgi:GNAT superfamily N-acetyltransferase
VSPEMRLLTLADVEPAAKVIARSFADDPLCAFMLPIKRSRIKTLVKFFRIVGEVNIKNQRGYGIGEPLQAVAYWKSPDEQEVSISIKSLPKFIPLLFTLYPIGLYRARAVIRQTDFMHTKYANQPHFYLDNIGVLPEARGKGLSSRLIRPFLDMADQQNVITYTDTVTRPNVALYEHFGFECSQECPVAGTGITVWALRRPVGGHS